VIFVNPCLGYRLEMMRDVDGFYDEVWPTPRGHSRLNGTALLALRKPAILWTGSAEWLKPDPDAFFQRHLYMGVYPTVPFPNNDHAINPDSWAEQYYLDYGPLMTAMRGRKWVLDPHCLEVQGGEAKGNLFEVPGGWIAPLMFGTVHRSVTVIIRNVPGLSNVRCEALLPGTEQAQQVPAFVERSRLHAQVPLRRGCAMLRLVKIR